MASKVKVDPPKPIDLTNVDGREESFRNFSRRWATFTVVSKLGEEEDDYQAATLMYVMGEDAARLVEASNEPKETCTEILAILENHCVGTQNELYNDYKFGSAMQLEGEDFDTFLARLRELEKRCNFPAAVRDRLMRNRVVLGIQCNKTRQKLLASQEQDLRTVIQICRSEGRAKDTLRKIQKDAELDEVNQMQKVDNKKPCKYCGSKHPPRQCKAYGKKCSYCGGKNHFAAVCFQAKSRSSKTNEVSENDDHESIDQLKSQNSKAGKLWVKMVVEKSSTPIRLEADSGSAVSTIHHENVPQGTVLSPSNTILQSWTGEKERPMGTAKIMLVNPANGKRYNVKFHVVPRQRSQLLSMNAIQKMGLISVNKENLVQDMNELHQQDLGGVEDLVNAYPTVFDESEVGTLPGVQHLQVNPEAAPKKAPVRRVPFAVKDDIEAELESLTARSILKQVHEPTDWESNPVFPRKPTGQVRVCIDPRDLNKALKRETYLMPTLDDALPLLGKARVFTVLDLKNGYWHVKLDEESSFLTTFNTPYGRFRWLRLPFGLNVSSEIFQRRLHQALEGLEGVVCVADDIVVVGEGATDEQANKNHDERLARLMERCEDKGIKLNSTKIQLRKPEIKFLGHLVGRFGLRPDPLKVKCIGEMNRPTDEKELRSFLGVVQYLSRFCSKLAQMSHPLRQLLKSTGPWAWGTPQQQAFEQIKEQITGNPVLLQYYDPQKTLTIECDASDTGLGAVLLQDEQPLAYVSRALKSHEARYAVIEKEMLAMTWSVERFHQYTFGRMTTVRTDHKPLERIMTKALRDVPRRLQNMRMRLQHYDLVVEYKPGRDQMVADMLSRTAAREEPPEDDQIDNTVHHITEAIPGNLQKVILEETSKDQVLRTLVMMIGRGWPEDRKMVPAEVRPYHFCRDEMAVYDGLVYRGERLVIPQRCRAAVKAEIHVAHQGVQACLQRARESVFWPGLTAEIQDMVSGCETCQRVNVAQPTEPMMLTETPTRPWEVISCDHFQWNGSQYLVTVDHYSSFFEVDKVEAMDAKTTIKKLKAHMARYGQPELLISDNGPQFACEAFGEFARSWDLRHQTASPHHPKANGKAEAAVKSAKTIMTKALDARTDTYKALLAHRNTVQPSMSSTPAQRLMGRRTRTSLPTTGRLLRQDAPDPTTVHREIQDKKLVSKKRADMRARHLEPLQEGDEVRIRPVGMDGKVWEKGVVQGRLDERSYLIRRNRQHLRIIPRQPPPQRPAPALPTSPAPARSPVAERPQTQPLIAEPRTPPQSPGLTQEAAASPQETRTRSGRLVHAPRRLIEE